MATRSILEKLWAIQGNSECVDCGVPEPDWASINLGVMVCLDCSGLHRQLGVHISQVRSVKLDTKCWDDALLDHMSAIGNTAFNNVWEANKPPEVLHPREYPDRPGVRERYIFAKYRDRAFMAPHRDAAAADGAAECRIPRGRAVEFESPVVKLSGARILGQNKWDARVLKLSAGQLGYYNKDQRKGGFPLEGCEVTLLDDDEYNGRPNTFSVRTPADSQEKGRTFVFQCDSHKLALEWVQQLRFAMEQPSPFSSSAASRPFPDQPASSSPSTLAQLSASLAHEAEARAGNEAIKAGACVALDVSNQYGLWVSAYAVLTHACFYLFQSPDLSVPPVQLVPLQSAEVLTSADQVPVGSSPDPPPARLAVWHPLSYISFAPESPDEHGEWATALTEALEHAQRDKPRVQS